MNSTNKIIGLDSLRFILAFIVLLGHGTAPNIPESIITNAQLNHYINGIIGVSFVGPAAVMVFFIISGIVIHYPYTSGRTINTKEFYLKRILRIAIPAIIALAIYQIPYGIYMGVVWSLICEVIYYLIYPLILRYIKHLNIIILSTFIFSYFLSTYYSATHAIYNGDFHRDGYLLTWVVGFPIWLLGLKIAENLKNRNQLAATLIKLNLLRCSVWTLSVITCILRFHYEIAYSFSLPIFSILAFFWIEYEIKYHNNKKENPVLEFGGLMSYSLYLIHAYVIFLIHYFYTEKGQSIADNWMLSFSAISISLLSSWIFYILIEKPSHKFTRTITITGNTSQQSTLK